MRWSTPEVSGVPPPGLRGHSATLIGNTVFMFGGYDGRGRSNELHMLDLDALTWGPVSLHEHAPSGRHPRIGVAIGDYVLDMHAAVAEGLMDEYERSSSSAGT